MNRRRGLAGLLAVLAGLALPASGAGPDPADPGTLEQFPYASAITQDDTQPLGPHSYLVYTPSTYRPGHKTPLVVMVHGCNTSALQQARANRYHPIAEREHFLVMYPDNAHVSGSDRGQCWKWFDPQSQQRDSGDPAIIAGMTREVMQNWDVDPERVYVMGMSSGAMMTSIMLATYPDLYAAGGIMAGCAYRAVACVAPTYPAVEPVAQEAVLAQQQMGSRARVVPTIVLHGDADGTVPPANAANVVDQWLQTDNLVTSGSANGPIARTPAAHRTGQVSGGRSYDVDSFTDPQGCLVAEKWTVHGMDHYWSGGSQDPAWYEWEDPAGPSAAEASWAFFSRYRLSETGLPCAESATPWDPEAYARG